MEYTILKDVKIGDREFVKGDKVELTEDEASPLLEDLSIGLEGESEDPKEEASEETEE